MTTRIEIQEAIKKTSEELDKARKIERQLAKHIEKLYKQKTEQETHLFHTKKQDDEVSIKERNKDRKPILACNLLEKIKIVEKAIVKENKEKHPTLDGINIDASSGDVCASNGIILFLTSIPQEHMTGAERCFIPYDKIKLIKQCLSDYPSDYVYFLKEGGFETRRYIFNLSSTYQKIYTYPDYREIIPEYNDVLPKAVSVANLNMLLKKRGKKGIWKGLCSKARVGFRVDLFQSILTSIPKDKKMCYLYWNEGEASPLKITLDKKDESTLFLLMPTYAENNNDAKVFADSNF